MEITSVDRVIDRHELKKLVPYSFTHIGRLERRGLFPKRVRLGPNRVGWLLSEIQAWIEGRKAARDALPGLHEGGNA